MDPKDEVASLQGKERGESEVHRSALQSMVLVVPEAQLLRTHSGAQLF